ncbi:MAG TPA: hypothetical protein VKJ47_13535 [Candidatus Binatia bacterium]|nr:hypothetical protein [Candidatus Binatia bacterium]
MATRSQVFTEIASKASALSEKLGWTLTKEQAINKVITQDPQLYQRYREAQPDPVPPAPGPSIQKAAHASFQAQAQQLAAQEQRSRVDGVVKLALSRAGETLLKLQHPQSAEQTVALLATRQQTAAHVEQLAARMKAEVEAMAQETGLSVEQVIQQAERAGIRMPLTKSATGYRAMTLEEIIAQQKAPVA